MNPYDFVRTDWHNPPERQKPKEHHKYYPECLSGSILCQLTAETLIFIPTSDSEGTLRQYFATHRKEDRSVDERTYYIPGSSLKGMLRSLVEVVGNGCYSKFDGIYEKNKVYYIDRLPRDFQKCQSRNLLCIGCRLFGFLEGKKVHKGFVQISDAEFISGEEFGKFKLHSIGGPSPHHDAFYLDADKKRIAGRKFYFHSRNPLAGKESDFNSPVIYPIKAGATFNFRINFDNLSQSELNTILYALVLEENMRHKIGYAKPLGLGSVKIEIIELQIIDRQFRYSTPEKQNKSLNGAELQQYLNKYLENFLNDHSVTFKDLRRIWAWPPPKGVKYEYPSYEWFREVGNSQLRLDEI